MSLPRGRVLRAASGASEAPPAALPAAARLPRGRRVAREVVDATERARQILGEAEARARTLVDAAARSAGDVRLRAEAEARADGVAAVAARALALTAQEARADERQLDRSVELARILAERLLGETLALEPSRVVSLARRALVEARGARRARVVAHPDDATWLDQARGELGLPPEAVEIVADPSRGRGDLRIETEIGVLDAALAPQLERLSAKLRESLGR